MDYTFTFVDRAGARGEYIILSKCSNKYMLFRDAMNCSLAMDLLKYDSEELQNIIHTAPHHAANLLDAFDRNILVAL